MTKIRVEEIEDGGVNLLNPKQWSDAEDWHRHHRKGKPHFEIVDSGESSDGTCFDPTMGWYPVRYLRDASGDPELCNCEEPDFPKDQFEWISF